jgi:Tlde1 domain
MYRVRPVGRAASGARAFGRSRRIALRGVAIGVAALALTGLIAGSLVLGARLLISLAANSAVRVAPPTASVFVTRAYPYAIAPRPGWFGSARVAFDPRALLHRPVPQPASSVVFVSPDEADLPHDETTGSLPAAQGDRRAPPELDIAALELVRLASSRPAATLEFPALAARPPALELARPAAPRRAAALQLASLAPPPPAAALKQRSGSGEISIDATPLLGPGSGTAIYDISARTVYLPDGTRLEAHSGLGSNMDDPRRVALRMRGPTPPNVYDLRLRESLFHGVRAIRLTPVDNGKMFGRDGMLAHSYMLGPNGQSNGCVSFKDYPAFLRAFLRGDVKRMVVVARLADAPQQVAALSRRGPAGQPPSGY